jgi:hypothetical protein
MRGFFMLPVNEQKVPFAKLAEELPPARSGKKCHLSTIIRWATRGARGPSGDLVRLEAARLGNRWVSTREALARFMERLTPAAGHPSSAPPPTPRTPTQRQHASGQTAEQLIKLGI